MSDGVKRAAMMWRGEESARLEAEDGERYCEAAGQPVEGGGGLAFNLFTLERIVKESLQY